jgi:DNA-binding MarR family transcriptional regulator
MKDRDYIDTMIAEWEAQPAGRAMGNVALLMRILRISDILEVELATLCAEHGIKPGQFQALAALRRAWPRNLAPSELTESTLLTSGAITPLLDRLEEKKLVRRLADLDDRRGVKVELTRAGRSLIDEALGARIDRLTVLMTPLSVAEKDKSIAALRKILLSLET